MSKAPTTDELRELLKWSQVGEKQVDAIINWYEATITLARKDIEDEAKEYFKEILEQISMMVDGTDSDVKEYVDYEISKL